MLSKRQGKRIAQAALLGLLAALLAGCWNAREIDELAFIMAVGVDKDQEEEGLVVSFRIANPTALSGGASGGPQGGGPGSTETTFTVMVKGKTVAEAVSRLRTQIPRRPYFSHLQGIILGESLARVGIGEVIDYFEREEELRRGVNIFVTKDITAAELFDRARQELITTSGIAISGLLAQAPETGFAPVVRLGDFLERFTSPRSETFAPVVTLAPATALSTAAVDQVALRGTAVFKGDKLAGYLDEQETALLHLIIGGFRWTTFPVSGGGQISGDVRVNRMGGSIRVIDPAELHFLITIQLRGTLKQVHSHQSIDGPQLVERMAYELQRMLQEKVVALVDKLKTWGTDIVDFGETLYRSHPRAWFQEEVHTNWPDLFAQSKVDVRVESVIVETGSIIRSAPFPQERPSEPAQKEGASP